VLPSLADLFAVLVPMGGLIGGTYGLAAQARTTRDLVRNVVDGATVGGLGGAAVALVIYVGGSAAGA
jgi:hypothetical protein